MEVEALGVGDAESAGQVKQFEAPFCKFDCGVSQIDSGVFGAGFGKLSAVSAESATHFQHREIFRACKLRRLGNMPLLFIAMLFDKFIKAARAGRRIGKLGSAGVLLPERTHTFFECGTIF